MESEIYGVHGQMKTELRKNIKMQLGNHGRQREIPFSILTRLPRRRPAHHA